MLGAKAIQQLAGEAEAACAAGEVERAAHLATQTCHAVATAASERGARVHGSAGRRPKRRRSPSDGELEPQVLADLVDLLRQQSLSAMDRFSAISPQLRRLLGKGSYELVRDHMDNLQFSDAADALEASQR